MNKYWIEAKEDYHEKDVRAGNLAGVRCVAQAAVLTIVPAAPEATAPDVANFMGCTVDANNVGTSSPTDPYVNDATTYVADDRGAQGQTFLTGSDPNGYVVSGVWVKHVTYTGSTDQTWYQMSAGAVLQVRITNPAKTGTDAFVLSTETYTVTGAEPNALPSGITNDQVGTGKWFHVQLAKAVKLAPNTVYGFDLSTLAGQAGRFFFETDGTSGDPYAAGSAYVSGADGKGDNNMAAAPGDRVFVVELQVSRPKIIWVSFHSDPNGLPTTTAAGLGFTAAPDKGYTDLLSAQGFFVTRVLQTGNPDVNALNAADLVIIGRSSATGSYQNANADNWNTKITAPVINMHGWAMRKNRLGFTTGSTNPVDTTGNVRLTVTDVNHPVFAGVTLTNGTMDANFAGLAVYPDGTNAFGISTNPDPIDPNGKIIAKIAQESSVTGPAGTGMIIEWKAGDKIVHDAALPRTCWPVVG